MIVVIDRQQPYDVTTIYTGEGSWPLKPYIIRPPTDGGLVNNGSWMADDTATSTGVADYLHDVTNQYMVGHLLSV